MIQKLLLPTTFFFSYFLNVNAQVSPLISTTWNQTCNYNADCPSITSGPCGKALTGCNATALAQILKYHAWPTTGWASNSYTPSGLPTQTVAFSAAAYNWSAMPNAISSINSEISKLMYHLGVSVDMEYGAGVSNSGFSSYALMKYFKYSVKTTSTLKATMTNLEWENLIKSELQNGRPVFVSGGSHFYIIDGFEVLPTLKFHVNFGWGGAYNGFYDINNVVVAGANYTPYQAMIKLKPLDNLEVLNDTIVINSSAQNAFSVLSSLSPWTQTSNATWAIPNLLYGMEGYFSFNEGNSFAISNNSSYSPRFATIDVSNGTVNKQIVIKQNGVAPSLTCSPSLLTYSALGESQDISIVSDSIWIATTSNSWLSLSNISGSGNSLISISASPNGTVARTGTVIIQRGSLSRTITINQASNANFWCIPNFASVGTNGISNVTLNTINRNSSVAEGYVNTGLSTILKRDSIYSLKVTFVNGNAPGVFADWNIDGDFNDANEQIIAPTSSWYPSFSGVKTVLFTVPATAVEGLTTLRVYAKAFGSGPMTSVCGVATDVVNCIEDYTLDVRDQRRIVVSPSLMVFNALPVGQITTIESDSIWTVSTSSTWVNLSTTNGIGVGSVTILPAENLSLSSRSATIQFVRGNKIALLYLSQNAADSVLNCIQTTQNVIANTNNFTFSVESNLNYLITPSSAWIAVNLNAGIDTMSFVVDVQDNFSALSRNAYILIQSGNFSDTLFVNQAAMSSSLVVTPNLINFPSDSSGVIVSITCPNNWSVSTSAPWILSSAILGNDNNTINVSAIENLFTARSGTVTISNGLITETISVNQAASTIGLDESIKQLLIYPNPVKNILTIQTDVVIDQVEVLLSNGKVVFVAEQNIIDLSELANGFYLIKLSTIHGIVFKSIVKN